jgi:hypothetical protein
MKHKVAELIGHELDALVLVALGHCVFEIRDDRCWRHTNDGQPELFEPSTRWEHGGPIIEREHIALEWEGDLVEADSRWTAGVGDTEAPGHQGWSFGPTPLVAAMRMFVYQKFGEEVELP